MELLIEARWVILKVVVGVILLFYLLVTGIHMSNRLPADRALFGVSKDVSVIINCPTNVRRIWEVVDRSRDSDEVLKTDGRFGDHYTEECG
tara:strand:- start:247 stop:519 length:273 start_codon:yes stop_codon:yes gene_type:complete